MTNSRPGDRRALPSVVYILAAACAVAAVLCGAASAQLEGVASDGSLSTRIRAADPSHDNITALAFSRGGRLIAVGGSGAHRGNRISLCPVAQDCCPVVLLDGYVGVADLCFGSGDSLIAAACHDQSVRLLDARSGGEQRSFYGHNDAVTCVAFHPARPIIASGSRDRTIKLWSIRTGMEYSTLKVHTAAVLDLSFSPNSDLMVSIGEDRRLVVWGVTEQGWSWKPAVSRTLSFEPRCVAFDPSGRRIALGGEKGQLEIWSVRAQHLEREVRLVGHKQRVNAVSFSPDSAYLASASNDATVRIWDIASEAQLGMHEGKESWGVYMDYGALAFGDCSFGLLLAAGDTRGDLTVWGVGPLELERQQTRQEPVVLTFEEAPSEPVVVDDDGEDGADGPTDEIDRVAERQVAESKYPDPDAPAGLDVEFIMFADDSGDGLLDGGERAVLRSEVVNRGPGYAYGCTLAIRSSRRVRGLILPSPVEIGTLPPGERRTVDLHLSAAKNIGQDLAELSITCSEFHGFHADPYPIRVTTRPFAPPEFVVAHWTVEKNNDGRREVTPGQFNHAILRLQNRGRQTARSVEISAHPRKLSSSGPFPCESEILGDPDLEAIAPGDSIDVRVCFFYSKEYANPEVEVLVELTEATGQYGAVLSQPIPVEKYIPPMREPHLIPPNPREIREASPILKDVERDIPAAFEKNDSAVAVVVGISRYRYGDKWGVDYAVNDAELMQEYLVTALGYEPDRVLLYTDDEATRAEIETAARSHLKRLVAPGRSDVFFYYSGHGSPGPDHANPRPYIVPYDCNPGAIDIGAYRLEALLEDLSDLGARSVMVVVDACYMGPPGSSPLDLYLEHPGQYATTCLFTGTTTAQVNVWYEEKEFSLFTYYFAKGLQGEADSDSDQTITVGEMEDYLKSNVPQKALALKMRPQTPYVNGDRSRVIARY